MIQSDDVIVFQGDSITDAARNQDDAEPNSSAALGRSYALMAGARLLCEHSGGTLKVYNRGVGGDRINELGDRWQTDTLVLRPSVVSILVGINDAAGASSGEPKWAQSIEEFARLYRGLLDRTINELPNVKLVICEPFLTYKPADMEYDLRPALIERQAVVRRIAADVKARFVAFQEVFDEACKQTHGRYWAADGVHPTPAGHYLMAEHWFKTVCA